MLRLYGIPTSGNCYKVELLLKQLGIPYETVEVNSRTGENRRPEYLAITFTQPLADRVGC